MFSLNNEEKSTVEILYSIHQMNKTKKFKKISKKVLEIRETRGRYELLLSNL